MDRFDTTAGVVWESFSEAEFREAARATRYLRRLRLPPGPRERYIDVLRTREHEWTHFRQHVSTPYGIFHWRLMGVQERMVQTFIQENPGHRGPFRMAISECIAADVSLPAPLGAWLWAHQLSRALWGAGATMEQLISLWEVRNQHSAPGAWLARPGAPRGLTTNRDMDLEAIPSGAVSSEGLVEGFAAYRELIDLGARFPGDDLRGYLKCRLSPEAERAFAYLRELLGLELGHPLGGALLELAILGFVDPVMAGPGDPLVWEEVCPSARLENAVRELARQGPLYPERPLAAYWVAREAMGLDESPDFTAQWEGVAAAAKAPVLDASPGDGLQGLAARCDSLYKDRAALAMLLRTECPFAYFAPEVVRADHPGHWQRFIDVGVPPVSVDPEGLATRLVTEQDASALVTAAIGVYAVDDLARYGRFETTALFLRRLASQEDPWQEAAHDLFEQMFADGYHAELRAQVVKAFAA